MPSHLTILGLGPGDPDQRTLAAAKALTHAGRIVLRTGIHPGVGDLLGDDRVTTCDDLYGSAASFDDVYREIVDRVLELLAEGDLVYAVPGSPTAGERTVRGLRAAVRAAGHSLKILPGVSGLDLIASVVDLDPMADQAQVIDALELRDWLDAAPFNGSLLDVSPARPVVVTQVYSGDVASAVKIALMGVYPADHDVHVVDWDEAQAKPVVTEVQMGQLDRRPVDHLTSIVVPPLAWQQRVRTFHELLRISARLRDEDGCPWDREQSHQSLRGAVIEEAFEVVDAIDANDLGSLADELGDLLLQVAMHAQIAAEAGDFEITDVLDAVSSKLIRRHPHVFGTAVATTATDVLATWNSVKATEASAAAKPKDPYLKLPRSMPASLKIAEVEEADGSTLSDFEATALADRIARDLRTLTRAGRAPDALIDDAYRILER
jgi:tetrapyrrole methylase family protein/MazG family protein